MLEKQVSPELMMDYGVKLVGIADIPSSSERIIFEANATLIIEGITTQNQVLFRRKRELATINQRLAVVAEELRQTCSALDDLFEKSFTKELDAEFERLTSYEKQLEKEKLALIDQKHILERTMWDGVLVEPLRLTGKTTVTKARLIDQVGRKQTSGARITNIENLEVGDGNSLVVIALDPISFNLRAISVKTGVTLGELSMAIAMSLSKKIHIWSTSSSDNNRPPSLAQIQQASTWILDELTKYPEITLPFRGNLISRIGLLFRGRHIVQEVDPNFLKQQEVCKKIFQIATDIINQNSPYFR